MLSQNWWFLTPTPTVLPNGVKVAVWDLSQMFQKCTNDYTEFLNLGKIHDCITLGFTENVCFTNKKGMEKLI